MFCFLGMYTDGGLNLSYYTLAIEYTVREKRCAQLCFSKNCREIKCLGLLRMLRICKVIVLVFRHTHRSLPFKILIGFGRDLSRFDSQWFNLNLLYVVQKSGYCKSISSNLIQFFGKIPKLYGEVEKVYKVNSLDNISDLINQVSLTL